MPESETSSPKAFRNWCRQLAEKSRDWFTESLNGLQAQLENSVAEVDRKIDEVLQENQELRAENQRLAARAQSAEAESQQLSELHSQIITLLKETCPEVWVAFQRARKS